MNPQFAALSFFWALRFHKPYQEAAMRVPSVGLSLEERRIVREGYRLAEHLLRDYRDPPGLIDVIRQWIANISALASTPSRSRRRD
jgi:hypothetical protein